MSDRFTISAAKIIQYKVFSFNDITLFHHECLNNRLIKRENKKDTWELFCSKCHKKITVRNNPKGTLPIIQTAVDGKERIFNHDLAKERVIRKE